MATQLQSIEIDGQTIWIEANEDLATPVASPATPGTETTSRSGRVVRTSGGTKNAVAELQKVEIASTLKVLITPIHKALSELGPEEVSVELSLGLKGEVGIFVAKSEGNAALKVTAKWKFAKPAADKKG